MDWLKILAGETRSRLLRLVRGAARTINELADALGITDNAVRTHVAALERDGLVRQAGSDRETGGKPARLYELTPGAEELFPKAYARVLEELVKQLRAEESDARAVARLRRVGRALGRGAAPRGAEDASRIAAACAVLESIGGSVEVSEDAGGWTIRAQGCPLSAVVQAEPAVCALGESLVAEVTHRRVIECCDRTDRPRCVFRVEKEAPARRAVKRRS